MKSIKISISLIVLCLTSCNSAKDGISFSNYQDKNTNDLAEFIIGEWQGDFVDGIDNVSYQLEFEEPNILYYRKNSSDPSKGEAFNFEYYFTDSTTIELKGRIRDEWTLSEDNDGNLIIHSVEGILPDAQYKRVVRNNNTVYFVGVIGFSLLLFFLIILFNRNVRHKNRKPLLGIGL
jgi:hypothetical protein